MQNAKDPEDETKSQFETFMAQYLGRDKEGLFEVLKQNEFMTPENLLDYLKPLYEEHIKIATGKRINKKLKKDEDAQKLLEYIRLLKEHNPDAMKGLRVPKTYKDINEVGDLYIKALNRLPETYHPKKPDTYQKK